jgi:Fur family ferric uptake transcriptional regulator
VLEFFEPRIESLQDEVCEKYGFLPLSHSHQMRGICRQCRPRTLRSESSTTVEAAKTAGRRPHIVH